MKKTIQLAALGLVLLSAPASRPAEASESGESGLSTMDWSFSGPFGTYDKASLQRGFQIYREVCANCHSLKRVAYRNLTALGYTEDQVKAIAGEVTLLDGPNDEGEMFERPGRPSDKIKSPFANDKAAMAANNGALPPDLSLIIKARHGGADYVYSVLTGYAAAPDGVTLSETQYYNKAMAGHIISMPAPLSSGQVTYSDGMPQTLGQYAKDIASFLTWTAEPEMEQRKRMGVKVVLFLLVFAGIMYAVKRVVWTKVH